jgi:ferritin-like metal-binding protein YciE
VARLEKIFQSLDASPKGKKCVAMEGLIEEGKELLEQKKEAEPSVLDAALIGAAQRVEHYEMAGYGCVRTFAKLLSYSEAEKLLHETLDEEAEADEKLSALAQAVVNPDALAAVGGEKPPGNGRAGKKKAARG